VQTGEKNARGIQYIIRRMSLSARGALLAVLLAALVSAACGTGLFGKQYEYEEDLYLSLDGSATVIVNTSLAALAALRGLDFQSENGRLDRNAVRAAFTTPVTEVTRVSRPWRRAGRQFVQVRVNVSDVRQLGNAAPFAWSKYELEEANGEHVFKQHTGPSALRPGTLKNVGWTGKEIVAFRLHLPSEIKWHNARDLETNQPNAHERGNILRWEQYLADRLDGAPVSIEVRMDSQSILYRTLWLFAGAFLAAVSLIVLLIWMTIRKGAKQEAMEKQSGVGSTE
jgi:hypothetical protein